jgi:hypothetical protein
MIVDKVPEVLEVSPRGSGDACLGKGETWKFQQSMFTRLDEIDQRSVPSSEWTSVIERRLSSETGQIQAWAYISYRMNIGIGRRSVTIRFQDFLR